ncbi:hypothetical protein GALMADRAFT_224115 [Galerina marginata CBS 339.88]|uniref:Uncharacterized protein n=1 Tax=Galerina marginata (strain CBS 339.88) TaxID=685588 RepID=A0A067TG34_GALM3|nr:hypothetical protein GALMADRAFT_224115 [Galerina marginata CBS 339.88]
MDTLEPPRRSKLCKHLRTNLKSQMIPSDFLLGGLCIIGVILQDSAGSVLRLPLLHGTFWRLTYLVYQPRLSPEGISQD